MSGRPVAPEDNDATIDLEVPGIDDESEDDPGLFLAMNLAHDGRWHNLPESIPGELIAMTLTVSAGAGTVLVGNLDWTVPPHVQVWWQRHGLWIPVADEAGYLSGEESLLIEGLYDESESLLVTFTPTNGSEVEDDPLMNVILIDLDMDSDNDDGTSTPSRSPAEELAEEWSSGKVLSVGDDWIPLIVAATFPTGVSPDNLQRILSLSFDSDKLAIWDVSGDEPVAIGPGDSLTIGRNRPSAQMLAAGFSGFSPVIQRNHALSA